MASPDDQYRNHFVLDWADAEPERKILEPLKGVRGLESFHVVTAWDCSEKYSGDDWAFEIHRKPKQAKEGRAMVPTDRRSIYRPEDVREGEN